jgi:hypothetical protein
MTVRYPQTMKINSLSLSPNCAGERVGPALSHCDIPPFIILSKRGGTFCINQRIRDAAPALQYRDKDYGIPKRERRQVRRYLADILLYHPSPLSSPLPATKTAGSSTRGEEIVEAYFLSNAGGYTIGVKGEAEADFAPLKAKHWIVRASL